MNEKNGESTPPKLKLSRDLKKSADKPSGPPPPPGAQKKSEPAAPTNPIPAPSNLDSFDPDDPFGDILPNPSDSDKAPQKKSGDTPKLDRARATPPQLPSKPAPRIDDGSSEKLEEALNPPPEIPKKSFPLASIIVVAVLLLAFAGASWGIWALLAGDSETSEKTADTADVEPGPAAGPITRARETIAEVPVATVPEINASTTPPVPAETSGATEEAETSPQPPTPSDSLRGTVSQFLTEIHVGGMRAGEQARVMLSGTSYHVGDLVDPKTGLTFEGIREGKLAFKDRNGIVYLKSF